jgi:hypothetical protein
LIFQLANFTRELCSEISRFDFFSQVFLSCKTGLFGCFLELSITLILYIYIYILIAFAFLFFFFWVCFLCHGFLAMMFHIFVKFVVVGFAYLVSGITVKVFGIYDMHCFKLTDSQFEHKFSPSFECVNDRGLCLFFSFLFLCC